MALQTHVVITISDFKLNIGKIIYSKYQNTYKSTKVTYRYKSKN